MQIQVKTYNRGDIIYDAGDKSSHLYFIRTGEIEVKIETISLKLIIK